MTMGNREASKPLRFIALDGLRGMAALLVVLLHVGWQNHLTSNEFVHHSYVAVDLFFIVSGFVISSTYLNRIATFKDLQKFIGLRLFRLYPLHLLMLGVFVVLECIKVTTQHTFGLAPGLQRPFSGGNSFGALIANLFLLNGLHVLDRLGWNIPSWSISCELSAYLLFSLAVLAGAVRRRWFYLVGLLTAVTSYVALVLLEQTLDLTWDYGIVRCMSGFFLGMCIFRLRTTTSFLPSSRLADTIGVVVFLAVVALLLFASGPLIVIVIPLFVVLVASLQYDRGMVAHFLASPIAQFIGRISYSIYMVHFLLVVTILIALKRLFHVPFVTSRFRDDPVLAVNPWIGDVLVIVLIIMVLITASGTYRFIEEPGRLLGRRLFTGTKQYERAVPQVSVIEADITSCEKQHRILRAEAR
jgi:peptidoglycan/LPS O-acetylase OafA/YrhL